MEDRFGGFVKVILGLPEVVFLEVLCGVGDDVDDEANLVIPTQIMELTAHVVVLAALFHRPPSWIEWSTRRIYHQRIDSFK